MKDFNFNNINCHQENNEGNPGTFTCEFNYLNRYENRKFLKFYVGKSIITGGFIKTNFPKFTISGKKYIRHHNTPGYMGMTEEVLDYPYGNQLKLKGWRVK